MKYKFLFEIYKNYLKLFKKIDCDSEDLHSIFYVNVSPLVFRFEEEYKIDGKPISRILDLILVYRLLDIDIDINKRFKGLKSILSSMDINDCKALYSFIMFVENNLNTEEVLENGKRQLTIVEGGICSFYNLFYFLLMILVGECLYLPSDIMKFNIGKELDKLVKNKEDCLLVRETTALDMMVNAINSAKHTRESQHVFCIMYFNLLQNFNALIISLSNSSCKAVLKNYMLIANLSFDWYTMITGALGEGVRHSFLDYDILNARHKLCNNFWKDMYDRRILIPRTGLRIDIYDNAKEKVLASPISAEFDDEYLGHCIISLSPDNCYARTDLYSLTHKYSSNQNFCACNSYLFEVLGLPNNDREFCYEFYVPSPSSSLGSVAEAKSAYIKGERPYRLDYATELKLADLNTDNLSKENNGKLSIKTVENVKINPFKRKLPSGQHRSIEATELAKKLCIKLEDNETIVSGFERKQHVNI